MISRSTFAFAATVALALWAVAPPAAAQNPPPPVAAPATTSTSTSTSTTTSTSTPSASKKTYDTYKGRVLSFNMAQIIVQSTSNEKMIWSFQYSAQLREKVAEMLSARPYQYGDRIQVYCTPGTMVAVKFKGKPSKSS